VLINRQAVEITDSKVKIPSRETVEFELRLRNYLTMVRKFKLEPKETTVWEVNPVPIPGPSRGQNWTVPYLGHVIVWIEPSSYRMGSPLKESGRIPNEGPVTEVTFTKGFWAGAYEVTQAQYLEIMDQNPSEFKAAKKPVENVTWKDAQLFCTKLTRIEQGHGRVPAGYVYRLPTEFEWELAARAGTSAPFSFGESANASLGNFRGVYPENGIEDSYVAVDTYGTVPVGSYRPNANGMFDVHGNVQEWTLDTYNARLPGGSLVDPRPLTDGSRIAARGGSWEDDATLVRSASREEIRMNTESNSIGFRIVLAPK